MSHSRRHSASRQQARRNLVRGCESLEPRLALAGNVVIPPHGDAYYTDKVIVRFEPEATQQQINALVGAVNGHIDKSFTGSLAGLKIINVPAGSQNEDGIQRILTKFRTSDVVRYADPNVLRTTEVIPNDARFSSRWDLNNTGQQGGIADADIDAAEAWDIATGSSNVVVAVIDTGIDLQHPDLVNNIWTNPGEIPSDGVDNDGNGYIDDVHGYDFVNDDPLPEDNDSHGSHVSGIVGAQGNNGIGVVGINWDVSIMPMKIFEPSGGGLAEILLAMDYIVKAKQSGINIVAANASYGGGAFDTAERDAIIALRDAGVLLVCSAGNTANDNDTFLHYPSNYDVDNVIAVAATNRRDQLSSFSNIGRTSVDLGAPGEEIVSTVPTLADPSGYISEDGTSMAALHVAGAAALIASVAPELTYAQIRDAIFEGVDQIQPLATTTVTGGRLNINNSLNKLGRSVAEGTIYTDKGGDGIIQPGADAPLPNIIVWYDVNKNGALDPGEPQSLSDANGHWEIDKLPDRNGGELFRISPPPLYQVTLPTSGFYNVSFAFNGDRASGLDFGIYGPPGQIEGHKWFDLNGNASLDADQGDGPMQNVYIYVDIDGDGRAGIGEPASLTDASGAFLIKNVPVGNYNLREAMQPGFGIAYPQAGYHPFTMTPLAHLTGYDFFNSPAHDYGDAPDSYKTIAASNGPVHGYLQGFGLGSKLDADGNGHPGPGALGDDNAFSDDEDGVIFKNSPSPGNKFRFTVTVMVPTGTHPGYLNTWMDFNRDGDFGDSGEKIIGGTSLGKGTYAFAINVPANTPVGTTYLRFRYGAEVNLGYAGPSIAGEVEDYAVTVIGLLPTAKDDSATVQQFSKVNKIDVLANDVSSVNGSPRIDTSSFPATSKLGFKLTLNNNGTPTNPNDDYVVYNNSTVAQPVDPTKTFYNDSFQYTITDGTNFDTATVNIRVNKISTLPIPIDDTVVAAPTGTTVFGGLLTNDLRGTDHGIPVSKVSLYSFDTQVKDETGATIGTMTRNNKGTPNDLTDDTLTFTPAAGANGKTGQFNYVLRNPNTSDPNASSSPATVTVQVHNDNVVDGNDRVKLSLEVRDTNATGGVATTVPTQLLQGQKYWVGIFADDLRSSFNDQGGNNANGALSVYMDLLFNKSYVTPIKVAKDSAHPLGLNIVYVDPYKTGNTGKTGDANTAGLINELGVTSSQNSIGNANKAVLYVQFTASAVTPGTTPLVLWTTDPADQRASIDPKFSHDIYVVNRTDTTKIDALPISQIAYFHSRTYRVVAPPAAAFAAANSQPARPTAPTAPQQNFVASSSPSSPKALDAVLASMYGDDSPYKKK